MTDFIHPVYGPAEQRTRETFLALMDAFSYPGRTFSLPAGDPFALIAETLIDLETSAYAADAGLTALLASTGSRVLPAESAAYHLYPSADETALTGIAAASVGTLTYPDHAATVVIGGCTFGSGAVVTMTGPGIKDRTTVQVAGLPARFWTLRASRVRFPLGWDVYLLDGSQVIGLPRSTQVVVDGGEG